MDNLLGCAFATETTISQREVEIRLLDFLRAHNPDVAHLWESHPDYKPPSPRDAADNAEPTLLRELHRKYLSFYVSTALPTQHLYCAQTWLVYWALQAAEMLGLTDELMALVPRRVIAAFLLACLHDGETGEAVHCPNKNNKNSSSSSTAKDEQNPSSDDGNAAGSAQVPEENITNDDAFAPVCTCSAGDSHCTVGFAGGRSEQLPHLATTYAAVSALCILSVPEALRAVPRAALRRWFLSLRNADGSFCMHIGGEADIRASYCVAVVTTLLQLDSIPLDSSVGSPLCPPLLSDDVARFVASCQTHEGGFACGGYSSEAHGAYTQCGLGALLIMQRPDLCNYAALRRWLAARQMSYEGGFNGRTNKLADSCYSHWVGASHVMLRIGEIYARLLRHSNTTRDPQMNPRGPISPHKGTPHSERLKADDSLNCVDGGVLTAREVLLLHHAQLIDAATIVPLDADAWRRKEKEVRARINRAERFIHADAPRDAMLDADDGDFLFNQRRMLLFVLSCCQNTTHGGLMDKPLCPNDAYHTCYSLSGMSSAQNHQLAALAQCDEHSFIGTARREGFLPSEEDKMGIVLLGKNPSEALRTTNPIFNLPHDRVLSSIRLWADKTFI